MDTHLGILVIQLYVHRPAKMTSLPLQQARVFPVSAISLSASNCCPEHHKYPTHRLTGTKLKWQYSNYFTMQKLDQASEHRNLQCSTGRFPQASLILSIWQ